MSKVQPYKTWDKLSERLEQYANAVSALGGMNDLDKALYAAAEGVRVMSKFVPDYAKETLGGFPPKPPPE